MELHDALLAAFGDNHLPAHVDKLRAHPDADERHLFLVLHLSALTVQLSDALSFGGGLPPNPPPLPDGVTHLWLAPQLSRRVLLGTADGWTDHHPYDN